MALRQLLLICFLPLILWGCVGDDSTTVDGGGKDGGGGDAPADVLAGDVTLSVTSGGNGGGVITSQPVGINCGTACSSGFPVGTSVVLTAAPSTGSTFGGWSGGGCSGTGTCTVTLTADTTVAATFTLQKLGLTVTTSGSGTVTSSPPGINCGSTCAATYDYGTSVTLTAAATSTTGFAGWSGGGCSGTATCVVKITAATIVTATFKSLATWDTSWSPAGVTFTNGNLSISGNSANIKDVRTTFGKTSGKMYWELTATGGDGSTDAGGIGILDANHANNLYIGQGASGLSWGYGSCCQGQYYYTWSGVTVNGAPPTGSAVANGITYMFALDMDTGTFWAGQNGTWYNGGDPSKAASPAATGITGTVYAGVTFYASSIDAFTANFGQSGFKYPVPTGFQAGFF